MGSGGGDVAEEYRVELPTAVRVWADSEDEAWKRAILAILGYYPRRQLSWRLRWFRPRWMGTVEGVGGFGTKVEILRARAAAPAPPETETEEQ